MKRSQLFSLLGALALCIVSARLAPADDKPEFSGFLGDYSQLKPRSDSQMIYNYVYEDPDKVYSNKYDKFLIDAITIFPSKDADFKGINANDVALLEKYFHDAVTKALTANNGYQVVEEPGPGVVRIRAAFTELVPVRPVMNTMTTILPQARILSGAINLATNSNFYVGQIGLEVEFLDAQTNERIAAVASKQAGQKYVPFSEQKFEPTSTWGQVEQAMDYWAQKLRKRVDALHEKTPPAAAN